MTTTTSATATDPYAALTASTAAKNAATGTSDAATADRFLKLLVTQMKNQDPLNPMDNAQITSQMAQINTVSGIQQLNTTVAGLNTQFVQMQALQGASLVGHDITLQGSRLDVSAGNGLGGYDLAATADSVKVQILSPAGVVVDTVDLGAETAGRHGFSWNASGLPDGAPYQFRLVATSGAAAVAATPLMRDRVQAVTTTSGGLVLQTQNSGDVAYADVKAFN
jgi:flagellar basal-body rod modification protein FlgD